MEKGSICTSAIIRWYTLYCIMHYITVLWYKEVIYQCTQDVYHCISTYCICTNFLRDVVFEGFTFNCPFIEIFILEILLENLQLASVEEQGTHRARGKRSSCSGFSWTSVSQGKNTIPFYKRQVINKSASVIFGLVRLIILCYNW